MKLINVIGNFCWTWTKKWRDDDELKWEVQCIKCIWLIIRMRMHFKRCDLTDGNNQVTGKTSNQKKKIETMGIAVACVAHHLTQWSIFVVLRDGNKIAKTKVISKLNAPTTSSTHFYLDFFILSCTSNSLHSVYSTNKFNSFAHNWIEWIQCIYNINSYAIRALWNRMHLPKCDT